MSVVIGGYVLRGWGYVQIYWSICGKILGICGIWDLRLCPSLLEVKAGSRHRNPSLRGLQHRKTAPEKEGCGGSCAAELCRKPGKMLGIAAAMSLVIGGKAVGCTAASGRGYQRYVLRYWRYKQENYSPENTGNRRNVPRYWG